MFNDEVSNPNRLIVVGPQPPPRQQRVQLRKSFGLDEKFAESLMRAICSMRRQAQFRGADQFQTAPARAVVGQSNASDFDVVIRSHGHFDVGLDASPAMPEFCTIRTKDCGVSRVFYVYRLVRHGPTRSPRYLAQIEEHSPTVASGVCAPTRELDVAPAAITGAGIGDHQRISGIAE